MGILQGPGPMGCIAGAAPHPSLETQITPHSMDYLKGEDLQGKL